MGESRLEEESHAISGEGPILSIVRDALDIGA
jgi:hypothetical protein